MMKRALILIVLFLALCVGLAPVRAQSSGTLKGFGLNDQPSLERPSPVSGKTVYQYLDPDWMMFGWQYAASNIPTYDSGWVIQLDQDVPTAAQLQAIVAKPNYTNGGRIWMLLNEQDLSGMTTAQAVSIVTQQKNAVLAVDPQARFALSLGSQFGAPQDDNLNWGGALWKALLGDFKSHCIAVFTHFYPQGVSDDPNVYFGGDPPRAFGTSLVNWRTKYATKYPNTEIWITEYGLDYRAVNDPRAAGYVWTGFDAFRSVGITRVSWYTLSNVTASGWMTLVSGNEASMNGAGKVFAVMQ